MPSLSSPLRALSDLLGAGAARLSPPVTDVDPPTAAPAEAGWLSGRTQQLWCEPGEHEWARLATRGRKPTACPAHREPFTAAP